jgi:phage-related protein
MGSVLVPIIGSLVVALILFLLSVLLSAVRSTRADLKSLENHIDTSLALTKMDIVSKVGKPDCIREMSDVRNDLKEVVRDMRELERKRG